MLWKLRLAFVSTICETSVMEQPNLIDQLGGTRSVADALQQKQSTVSMWKARAVPWRWRAAVQQLAEEKGVAVPADFSGRAA